MVDENAQQLIMQAQSYQQQFQMIAGQKEALNLQIIETGKALEELAKPGEDEVYKITGPVLIKVTKKEAKKDLETKKDLAMLRMKTIEKSETSIKQKLEELKDKLAKAGV